MNGGWRKEKILKHMVLWIIGGILILFLIIFFTGYVWMSAPEYEGEVSDHFNGEKFFNPNHVAAKNFGDVIKWYFNRDQGEWKELTNIQYGMPPPKKIMEGELSITFVNHSTFLIQLYGMNILTDPIWSERSSPFSWIGPKRMRPPGIKFEDLPPIDIVLISHNHYDHLDIPTLKRIYEDHRPRFYTPLGVAKFLEENNILGATDMDWWDELALSNHLKLVNVPAQHFSGRGMADKDATLWSGYVIKSNSGNIYFAGDTGYNDRLFRKIGEECAPINLSLIPIGAYRPQWFMSPIHVSPEEAVQIHSDTKSEKSVAIHFGTFPMADDGMHEPVRDLEKALKEAGISNKDFMVMKEGEIRKIAF